MPIEYRDGIAGKVCANPECREWKPLTEFHPQNLRGVAIGVGVKSRCKDCLNAERRAKRAANPEIERAKARVYVETKRDHIRKIKRAHQKAHPEKYAEALRKHRATHREEINTRARARRQSDLEHYREIGRNSRERHREERNVYQRAYTKSNRAQMTAAANRRRARKFHAEGSHTLKEWELLKVEYDYTCLRCRKHEPEITLTRDHIVPLEKGGCDSINNIQPLCASCNSRKSAKVIDYRIGFKSP